jgi:hypothetical protein
MGKQQKSNKYDIKDFITGVTRDSGSILLLRPFFLFALTFFGMLSLHD